MQNKLRANKFDMLTKFLKKLYVQSRVADNALAQISLKLKNNTARLFKTAKKILDMLIAAFGNKNQKREAQIEYKLLKQKTQNFNMVWVEF